MIVTVSLRIATDDGIPVVVAESSVLVTQQVADFEGTVSKSAMALDELVERETKAARKQIRAYREAGPPSG